MLSNKGTKTETWVLEYFADLDFFKGEICLIVISFTNSFMKMIQIATAGLLSYVKSIKTIQQGCLWV